MSFPMKRMLLVWSWLGALLVGAQAQALDQQVQRADSLYEAGAYPEAQALYGALAETHPEAERAAYFARREVRSAVQRGAYAEAEALARRFFADRAEHRRHQAAVSQYLALAFAQQGQVDSALKYTGRNLAWQQRSPTADTAVWARGGDLKAFLHLQKGQADSARYWIGRAHALREAFFAPDARELGYGANTLYLVLDALGELEAAEAAAQQAYRILHQALPPGHPHLALIANNLSVARADQGDPQGARRYLQKAIDINWRGRRFDLLLENYFNLSYLQVQVEDWANAELNARRALSLADSIGLPPGTRRADLLEGLGAIYYGSDRLPQADSLFRLTLAMRQAIPGDRALLLADTYYDLGLVARDRQRHAEARRYLSQALALYDQRGEFDPSKRADVAYEMAELDWQAGKQAAALTAWRETLSTYRQTRGAAHPHTLEALARLAEAFAEQNQPDSVRHYLGQGWRALGRQGPDPFALHTYAPSILDLGQQQADWALQQRHSLSASQWRGQHALMQAVLAWLPEYLALFPAGVRQRELNERVQRFYRQVARLAHHGWQASQPGWDQLLLRCMQETRGASIRGALQRRAALRYAGVPGSLVHQSERLEEQLRYLYQRDQAGDMDSALMRQRSETYEAWQALQRRLAQDFPAFYTARYQFRVPSLAELQRSLGDEALLAYLWVEDGFVVLKVGAEQARSFFLPFTAQDRLALQDYPQKASFPADVAVGRQLYQTLWEPLASDLPTQVRVLPDGPLYRLNFEALLYQPIKDDLPLGEYPFLLKKHRLYYAYQLQPQANTSARASADILGVAPGFTAELKVRYQQRLQRVQAADSVFLSWVSTPWSLDFVDELKAKGWGQGLTGLQATEATVLAQAREAGILHFGTHARLQNDEPLMSFLALTPDPNQESDGYLRAYELYQQLWSARMAVLTACETGIGPYRAGEGLLSLAHAFRYAGCPTVVHSLWSIDDAQTQVLMEQFYPRILAGERPAEALRQAKLTYLSSETAYLEPYFWAGLVVTGENEPVVPDGSPWLWGLALLGVGLGLWGWWVRRAK